MIIKNYSTVVLEITRRCTRACGHCMRGEAQNVTITKEIIDKLFNDAPNIEAFILTGGEPLLEMDMIEYLCHKIINSGYSIQNKPFGSNLEGAAIHFVTNGDIIDERIIDILYDFCLKTGFNTDFTISNDDFHDSEHCKNAYAFYSEKAEKANKQLQGKTHGRICVTYFFNKYGMADKVLKYEGNACDLIDSGLSQYRHGIRKRGLRWAVNVLYPNYNYSRVCITKNKYVRCVIEICANGNVVPGMEDTSFIREDALTVGNILDKPLEQILLDHNASCLCLCSEKAMLSILNNIDNFLRYEETKRIEWHIVKWITDRIIELRQKAKRSFPFIPAQDVIDMFPFPKEITVECLIDTLYEKIKARYNDTEIIGSIDSKDIARLVEEMHSNKTSRYEANQRLKYLAVLSWLKNEPDIRVCISKDIVLHSSEKDIENSPAFLQLRELNEEYRTGKRVQSNEKVYDCNMRQDYQIDSLMRSQNDFGTGLFNSSENQKAKQKKQEKQALMDELRHCN